MTVKTAKGTIVKGIAGFYYVKADDGAVYQCRARGIFKKDGITPSVGDAAEITVQPDGDAVVERIFPRTNEFARPPIVNVDTFVIVCSAKNPDPNPEVIDKFMVMAEKNHTEIILCITKTDLVNQCGAQAETNIADVYDGIYSVYKVCAKTGEGISELKKALAGKKAALAGPSGAGKSTLLNALIGDAKMETGDVSRKTGRGKNTTRHAELFEMSGEEGGYIFDTPGFTSFDLPDIGEDELAHLYPEFAPYIGSCRYDNCRHIKEPGCAVRDAVSRGKIKKERYRSYALKILEIREREKNKY